MAEKLPQIADVATIVGPVLVLISFLFIWYELRENRQLTKAANTQSLVEMSSPFNLLLAENRDLAKLWLEGADHFANLDKVDQWRYRFLLYHSLTLQENIYYQGEEGLIDSKIYGSWTRSFEEFVREHHLSQHWPQLEPFYHPDFAGYVAKRF